MRVVPDKRRKVQVGQVFGRLTVIGVPFYIPVGNGGRFQFAVCECDCGKNTAVRADHMRSGRSRSCGCLSVDTAVATMTKHGMTIDRTTNRLYFIWKGMLGRCNDEHNSSYKNYGKRGIRVCDEWMDVKSFVGWALSNGYREDLTIDRIDNDGNYEPSNCRWANMTEQGNNRRGNRWIEAFGERKTMSEWLADERCSVNNYQDIQRRLRNGWTTDEAIGVPPMTSKNSKVRPGGE